MHRLEHGVAGAEDAAEERLPLPERTRSEVLSVERQEVKDEDLHRWTGGRAETSAGRVGVDLAGLIDHDQLAIEDDVLGAEPAHALDLLRELALDQPATANASLDRVAILPSSTRQPSSFGS